MTIPPFPSQDLAKLVLGYLAEEELMTAYDEFLQTSPYLDVHNNEYDWLLMTSLKRMLAEYRAVKIYVNNCKPLLRKKLFQCANLVEVVKYLVNHIDVNKLRAQEAYADDVGWEKQNAAATSKTSECEGCSTSKTASSGTNLQASGGQSASHVQACSLESSVEATLLADLPGNFVTTRKKHVRILDKDTILIQSNLSSGQTSDASVKESNNSSKEQYMSNYNSPSSIKSSDKMTSLNSTVKTIDISESRQKIEEFNDVLKSVVSKNNTVSEKGNLFNRRISTASTFQDFASGVTGSENQNANMPDSSTSENLCTQVPITKEQSTGDAERKCQLTLVGNVKNNSEIQPNNDINSLSKCSFSRIKPKTDEHKIKILSNIKVDNKHNNYDNQKKNNATSTPLMQMQTIVINGTPAYRHNALGNNHNFTKDEIMAMPTLIVVPAPGASNQSKTTQSIPSQNVNVATTMASSTARILGPLIIDVTQSPTQTNKSNAEAASLSTLNSQSTNESGLVKTVDVLRNASVPKDNTVSSVETNTPQVLPLTRKSSSTPRRSSHIRVLDFTTPRRILHETISEKVPCQNAKVPVEIDISGSPNVQCPDTLCTEQTGINKNNVIVRNLESCNGNVDCVSAAENDNKNQIIFRKKYNWDADLRALAVANARDGEPASKRISKSKSSKKKKNNVKSLQNDEVVEKKPQANKKLSPKIRKSKKRRKIEDEDEPLPDVGKKDEVPIIPTINIISGLDRGIISTQEVKKGSENNHNESGHKNEIETPEVDKIALQNAIGAKLNISELLETPYKQALYDIQMETPRFIGLPDEPISDIKIMNIPTPRFFNTPKHAQATPSSSSCSRPTDYSSGGSYYKPDDQDYMPIPDLGCPVSSSKEDCTVPSKEYENGSKKTSRPVRQCTKNVSYYNSSGVASKIKEVDDNVDMASSCSDTLSLNNSSDCKSSKDCSKSTKELSKSETRKRSNPCKKRKSPTKVKLKSFMKIKPRRPTPPRESTSGRSKKKSFDTMTNSSPKLQRRKRTTSKERNINLTPVINSVPTKSRRKSSTPRKLHCTKTCNSGSIDHSSPETITHVAKPSVTQNTNVMCAQDSDTEQLALRWSDDGSQDTKSKEAQINPPVNESEDILKIQEYIKTTDVNTFIRQDNEGTLQADLIKRGFDVETAKIIERDLLDTPPHSEPKKDLPVSIKTVEIINDRISLEKTVEKDSSVTDDLQIVQDEVADDEIELSVYECNEESKNYVVYDYDTTKDLSTNPPVKLKDKFSMEVCIDDGVAIRLRATPFSLLFDQDPQNMPDNYKETEVAIRSISNIEKLYTPLKDPIKAQCYEIFDSTLTSLDTPLKMNSPKIKEYDNSVTEIVLEVEKVESKEKTESKKRKRMQSGSDESVLEIKKVKPDAQYIFNSANIQNIDIESVLKKLHGP